MTKEEYARMEELLRRERRTRRRQAVEELPPDQVQVIRLANRCQLAVYLALACARELQDTLEDHACVEDEDGYCDLCTLQNDARGTAYILEQCWLALGCGMDTALPPSCKYTDAELGDKRRRLLAALNAVSEYAEHLAPIADAAVSGDTIVA